MTSNDDNMTDAIQSPSMSDMQVINGTDSMASGLINKRPEQSANNRIVQDTDEETQAPGVIYSAEGKTCKVEKFSYEELAREAISIWERNEVLGGLSKNITANNVSECDKKKTESAVGFDQLQSRKVVAYEDGRVVAIHITYSDKDPIF